MLLVMVVIECKVNPIRETPYTRMLTLEIQIPNRPQNVVLKSPVTTIAAQAEHLSLLDDRSIVRIIQDGICRAEFVKGELAKVTRMEYCSDKKSIDIPYRGRFL